MANNDSVPNYSGFFRSMNIWVLNRFDLVERVPQQARCGDVLRYLRSVACGSGTAMVVMFTTATLVWIATIYRRYHYAADGLASLGISALAWRATGVIAPK